MTSSSKSSRGGRLGGLKHNLKHAARLGMRDWADLGRATVELAVARVRLGTRDSRELLRGAQLPSGAMPSPVQNPGTDALVDRVAFAIPRVGRRVPWRADCLVQALAAQHWLGRRGVATSLVIGVRKPQPADFEAHAWLMAGDRIVTGGEVGGYHPIFKQD